MSTPAAPVFLFDSKEHWIDLWNTAHATLTLARFLDPKQFECIGYDAKLTAWRVRWKVSGPSLWHRAENILGRSRVEAAVQWAEIGTYCVEELRDNFMDAVAHDDDVLTRFVDREELLRRLRESASFADFVRVWESLLT